MSLLLSAFRSFFFPSTTFSANRAFFKASRLFDATAMRAFALFACFSNFAISELALGLGTLTGVLTLALGGPKIVLKKLFFLFGTTLLLITGAGALLLAGRLALLLAGRLALALLAGRLALTLLLAGRLALALLAGRLALALLLAGRLALALLLLFGPFNTLFAFLTIFVARLRVTAS